MRGTRVRAWWVLAVAAAVLGGCAARPDEAINRRHEAQRKAMVRSGQVVGRNAAGFDETLVFTSFRGRGDPGLHLATSRDGYTWEEVSEGPVWTPEIGGVKGMRDPSVARGPDGVYHMVWTLMAPMPRSIGYARSTDLLNWTDARAIQVVPDDWDVKWTWAPELFYDQSSGEWIIAWSTAVAGRHAETEGQAEENHRIYCNTTRDFKEVSPARPYLDPGYPVIDPSWLALDGEVLLFFKDERHWGKEGKKKQIRYVRGPGPHGPWSEPSDAITMRWCEGPSPIVLDGEVVVYFDEYTRDSYGAVRSRDLKQWDDISALMSFPRGHRHGSVIRVPEEDLRRLEERRERERQKRLEQETRAGA